MSVFVVDASVVIKWFIAEPNTDAARRLLNTEKTFLAPEHLFAETANAVWKKVRRGEISTDYGRAMLSQIDSTCVVVETVPCRDLAADAYMIAVTHGRTVYDAMYLALAIQRNTRLITADNRLYNALANVPGIAPYIQSL